MIVKQNNKFIQVFREDDKHFYVRNSDGIIQGMIKSAFQKLDKKELREQKLKRVLNIEDVTEEIIRIPYDINESKIYVNWSGRYPNLCSGQWTIKIDNMHLPIPEYFISSPMNTCGTYQSWHFESNWSEVWDSYDDGSDWFHENDWLHYAFECLAEGYNLIWTGDRNILREIYEEITEKDWRSGSCGGCI